MLKLVDEKEHGWWFMPNVSDSEVLWGGERGPGLVFVVAQLTQSVADLTKIVSGNEGLQAQVTRLVTESQDEKLRVQGRIDRLWQVGMTLLGLMATGVAGLIARAFVVASQHHL